MLKKKEFIGFVAIALKGGHFFCQVKKKKKDIKILKTMGAGKKLIRNIFLTEGILLSMAGCIIGFFIAFSLCVVQIKFGVIKIQGDSFAFK